MRDFSELLYTLSRSYTEEYLKEWVIGQKIFEISFFNIQENSELGLKRFKDVYFYTKSKFEGKKLLKGGTTLPRKYINYESILKFLISEKEPTTNLIFYGDRSVKLLKYFLEDLKLDINQANEAGWYPLIAFSSFDCSRWELENKKKAMDFLLEGEYELNLSIKDSEGRTISERIKLQNEEYERQFKE